MAEHWTDLWYQWASCLASLVQVPDPTRARCVKLCTRNVSEDHVRSMCLLFVFYIWINISSFFFSFFLFSFFPQNAIGCYLSTGAEEMHFLLLWELLPCVRL